MNKKVLMWLVAFVLVFTMVSCGKAEVENTGITNTYTFVYTGFDDERIGFYAINGGEEVEVQYISPDNNFYFIRWEFDSRYDAIFGWVNQEDIDLT